MIKKIKNYLNEENKKINKIDIITILIITILYAILSFYNLGSNVCPNTFQRFHYNEKILIELDKADDIILLKIFNGEQNSKYKLSTSLDNINYQYINEIEGRGAFSWDIIKPKIKAKYILLEFTDSSTLGELALYNNSKKKIKIKNITYKEKSINELTDEQNTIPDNISYMNSSYFDEIYFARTAYEYVYNIPTYEWTHPPLGKLIQAIPIFITKHLSPFNYRLMGNISGILMIVVMYFLGKELFKKRKYSIFASLLLFFDTFHFVQTRMGTVDSHLVLFMMLSVLFMIKFYNSNKTTNLLISGIFFGLSVCTKWTGFYCGLGLAIIYFTYILKNKQFNLKHIIKGTSFFVLIPLLFYLSLYLLFPNNNLNYTNSIKSIINQQQEMYNYHSKLEDTHFFSSKWYTWPISYKPVWYHEVKLNNEKETISGLGNIIIWWLGVIAILYLIPKIILKKDKNDYFILVLILSLWLPYSFIGRVMFLYHYFPVTPFMMLAIVSLFKEIEKKFKNDYIIPIYLILVIAFFIVYYPIVTGTAISNDYVEKIKILNSWYF